MLTDLTLAAAREGLRGRRFTARELTQVHLDGVAALNGAVALARDGAFEIDGSQPINPSGGLVARGHPIGATGAAQLVELADQLRGRAGQRQVQGARIGLAENAGGSLGNGPAACVVTILAAQ